MATIAAILGRMLLALLFVMAGLGKIMDPAGTAQYIEATTDMPGTLALPTGIFELVAGLVLASGYATRLVSVLLIGFTALATILFHSQVTDQTQATMALKNLAIIGGLLMVFAYGQVRGRMGVLNERDKAHRAEVRAAHAEGRLEATEKAAASE